MTLKFRSVNQSMHVNDLTGLDFVSPIPKRPFAELPAANNSPFIVRTNEKCWPATTFLIIALLRYSPSHALIK